MKKNIILTGGGTAGHIMPNIALIPHLKKYFDNIYYVGSKNGVEKELIKNIGIPYFEITTAKLKRNFSFDNFKILGNVLKGIKESKILVDKLKPMVIFSKGGFVALPITLACKKKNVPIVLHESDLTIGLSNRLCLKKCDKLLTSFSETSEKHKNGIFTGSAIRESLFNYNKHEELKKLNFLNDKKTILFMGGSSGSRIINESIFSSLDRLLPYYNIIHITGKNNLKNISKNGYFSIEFTSEIGRYMTACDMVVSRSGSNSIFEFLAFNKPMLLIPLSKKVSRGDQILNAKYFFDKGFALVLEEENLNANTLYKSILELDKKSTNITNNMKSCGFSNGTKKICEEIILSAKRFL